LLTSRSMLRIGLRFVFLAALMAQRARDETAEKHKDIEGEATITIPVRLAY
jgi:hypothetical protein